MKGGPVINWRGHSSVHPPTTDTHTKTKKRQTKKVVPKRIVLYGRSIGSGPSCYLAERLSRDGTPVGGLILQVSSNNKIQRRVGGRPSFVCVHVPHGTRPPCASYTPYQSPILSVYRVALPLRFTLCGDIFPNIDRVPHIESPLFVIHGTRDEIVPFQHGQVTCLRKRRACLSPPVSHVAARHTHAYSL